MADDVEIVLESDLPKDTVFCGICEEDVEVDHLGHAGCDYCDGTCTSKFETEDGDPLPINFEEVS